MRDGITIKVISDACGILPQTLRAWEKRYQAFSPKRSESGQRLYSQKDLKKAMALSSLIKRGFTISQIAGHSNQELHKLLEETNVVVEGQGSTVQRDLPELYNSIVSLISDFKFDELNRELQSQRTLMSVRDFIFELCIPVIRLVGDAVIEGRFSVTQEHIVSTLIRGQLGELKSPIDLFVKSQGSVHRYALATPEGNNHELSIIIADLICGVNRRLTNYLGVAHPADSLAQAISALKCDRVILGTIHSELWQYDKEIIPYLSKMDENLEIDVEVILGGAWSIEFPKFKKIKEVHFMESFRELDEKLFQHFL